MSISTIITAAGKNSRMRNDQLSRGMKLTNKLILPFNNKTVIGSLSEYISSPKDNFQPMNANFGILPELGEKIRDKKERYSKLAERSLEIFKKGI